MTLLFYSQSMLGGGAERVMSTLVNYYAHNGDNVYLATNTSLPIAYEIDNRVNVIDMYKNEIAVTRSPFNRIRRHLWKYKRIRSIAKMVSPDVAISFITSLNNDVIFSLLGTRIPVIVSEHTNINRHIPRKTFLIRKVMYPFATVITVLTRRDYNQWRSKYRNLVYMPNPCEINWNVTPCVNRRKTVLAVGTVNSWQIKGFDILLNSWGLICSKHPQWTLQIAGTVDESSLTFLEGVAQQAGCINYEFLGFRNDVRQLMLTSGVFVLSSRTEGLPMVLIEAMNAGCCCVASNCETGPSEIIKNNVSGLLAETNSAIDLASKLDQVLSDEDLRSFLSSNAPASVARFSVERIIRRWNVLLGKIINES